MTRAVGSPPVPAETPGHKLALMVKCARLATLIAATIVIGGLAGKVRVNYTSSLPIGLYRTVGAGGMARGSIVLLCLPEPIAHFARERDYIWRGNCPGDAAPVGKLVLAVEGDTVRLTKRGVYVNGRPVPNTRVLETDTQRRPVPHYPFGLYPVARNDVWIYSPYHRRSFDSRYFGPVPVASVRSHMLPVWVARSNQAKTIGFDEFCAPPGTLHVEPTFTRRLR